MSDINKVVVIDSEYLSKTTGGDSDADQTKFFQENVSEQFRAYYISKGGNVANYYQVQHSSGPSPEQEPEPEPETELHPESSHDPEEYAPNPDEVSIHNYESSNTLAILKSEVFTNKINSILTANNISPESTSLQSALVSNFKFRLKDTTTEYRCIENENNIDEDNHHVYIGTTPIFTLDTDYYEAEWTFI